MIIISLIFNGIILQTLTAHLPFALTVLNGRDLTDIRMIERDFSRKKNTEEDQRLELAVLACRLAMIMIRVLVKSWHVEGL